MPRSKVQHKIKTQAQLPSQSLVFKTKNFDRFHQYVTDLCAYLKDLIATEYQDDLIKAIRKYKAFDKQKYLEYTLNNLTPYIDQLAKADETIFLPEYSKQPLNFLIGFDFRILWKQNLSMEEKRVIFRYLLYMYMQSSAALGKNRDKVKEILEIFKIEKEIAQEAQNNPNAFGDDDTEGTSITDIFGEDSVLVELAQEISQEINFSEMLNDVVNSSEFKPGTNPMETVGNMFSHPKMQEKLKQLGDSLNQKVQDKELNEQDILGALQTAQANIAQKMSGNVGGAPMAQFIKNMDIGKMMESFKAQVGDIDAHLTAQAEEMESVSEINQEELQEKLQQLKENLPFGDFMKNMVNSPAFQQMIPPTEENQQMGSSAEVQTGQEQQAPQHPSPNLFEQMMNPEFRAQMRDQVEQMKNNPQFMAMMTQMQSGFSVDPKEE